MLESATLRLWHSGRASQSTLLAYHGLLVHSSATSFITDDLWKCGTFFGPAPSPVPSYGGGATTRMGC